MKNIFNKLMIMALVAIASLQAEAQVTGCYVPTYQQSQNQWCWATSGAMVYWNYKPGSLSPCTFVNKARDRENSWGIFWIPDCDQLPSSTTSACSSPSVFNYPQYLAGCRGSIADVLGDYGIPSTNVNNSLSAADLTTAMSNRRLCVAGWFWTGGGGHAVVINRYKSGNVSYNDPWTGSAYTVTYNSFKTANGGGNWGQTLRMNNTATYGSIYYRPSDEKSNEAPLAEEVSMTTYPNPTSDNFNIKLSGFNKQDNKVIIMDAVGKVIYSETLKAGDNSTSINVSSWAKGMYFVCINDNPTLVKQFAVK